MSEQGYCLFAYAHMQGGANLNPTRRWFSFLHYGLSAFTRATLRVVLTFLLRLMTMQGLFVWEGECSLRDPDVVYKSKIVKMKRLASHNSG